MRKKMKFKFTGWLFGLIVSAPILAADYPAGPSNPNWPPAGGQYPSPAGNPAVSYPGYPSYFDGTTPTYRYHPPVYRRELPVLPPSADWPGAAYGYEDMMPRPQPGQGVQVIPPPSIPLQGDIMDTTLRPVRQWRPQR